MHFSPVPYHFIPLADFDIIDQLMIRFFALIRYWRKTWEYNETVYQPFIDFKEVHDSFRREVM
jgi:hypothetical protein